MSYVIYSMVILNIDHISVISGVVYVFFFFSSRRRHTRLQGDWSSDVCSSDLHALLISSVERRLHAAHGTAQSGAWLEGPLRDVPPLLSLERLVFRLIGAAFAVLTVTFVVGIAYSESFLGRAMRFDHKTLFEIGRAHV